MKLWQKIRKAIRDMEFSPYDGNGAPATPEDIKRVAKKVEEALKRREKKEEEKK